MDRRPNAPPRTNSTSSWIALRAGTSAILFSTTIGSMTNAARFRASTTSSAARRGPRLRSEGRGEAANINGQKESDMAAISSTATKNALEIEGKADAEAASIYAVAFNPPDAQELYSFLRSLDVMRAGFEKDTTAVISTSSELGRLLKSMAPTSAAPKPTGP